MKLCPACSGNTTVLFDNVVLGRHVAAYRECEICLSLHVADPHWLEEAYADPDLADAADPGAAWRNERAADLITALELPDGPWLDFGAGQRILEKILSKRGHTILSYDPYRFDVDPCRDCSLVVALEVLEHQVSPHSFVRTLAGLTQPDGIVLISTWLRQPDQHGDAWPYLATSMGQHVFFATKMGLQALCTANDLPWRGSAIARDHGGQFQIHVLSRRPVAIPDVEGFSVQL